MVPVNAENVAEVVNVAVVEPAVAVTVYAWGTDEAGELKPWKLLTVR